MTSTTRTGGLVRTYTTPAGGGGGQAVRTESDPIAARIRPNVASFLICLPQRAISAPAAFSPVGPPAVVSPVTCNPSPVAPRGNLVAARDPDVRTAVPAVIATNPDVPGRRRNRRRLDDEGRRG